MLRGVSLESNFSEYIYYVKAHIFYLDGGGANEYLRITKFQIEFMWRMFNSSSKKKIVLTNILSQYKHINCQYRFGAMDDNNNNNKCVYNMRKYRIRYIAYGIRVEFPHILSAVLFKL